jgi:NADPH2:quinone reductase
MHAIRQHEFGAPEVLQYEEVPDPEPGSGQVRIAVAAAGVHLIDTRLRAGTAAGPFPAPDLPMTPGREVAGTIDAVGPDVPASLIGTRVVAHLGAASGGYAELALASASAIHELPAGRTPEAAVALIGTGRTTMAILDSARLTPDDVVLITAAAGGIGTLLIQAALSTGAYPIAAAGGQSKVDAARRLGAALTVDYTDPDWTETVRESLQGKQITVAFDGVGGSLGRGALELLGPGGRLLMYGMSSGEPIPLTAGDLFYRGLTAGVAAIGKPLDTRDLETRALAAAWTPLTTQFPLSKAAESHNALQSRATMGKTVLIP